jgi:hypothetical protein
MASASAKRRPREAEIVDIVAEILMTGEPSRFRFEALCRHTLRSARCLQRMPWAKADTWAAKIVREALGAIGAQRPSWAQGQPEWTQPGIINNSRTRCVQCGKRLPENHHRYCGPVCARASHNYRAYLDHREDLIAYHRAYRAAKRLNGLNGANGATRPCRSAPTAANTATKIVSPDTLPLSPHSNERRPEPADIA